MRGHGVGGTTTDMPPGKGLGVTSLATVPFVPLTVNALSTVNAPVEPVKFIAAFVPAGTADVMVANVMSRLDEFVIDTAGSVVEAVEIEFVRFAVMPPPALSAWNPMAVVSANVTTRLLNSNGVSEFVTNTPAFEALSIVTSEKLNVPPVLALMRRPVGPWLVILALSMTTVELVLLRSWMPLPVSTIESPEILTVAPFVFDTLTANEVWLVLGAELVMGPE